MSVATDYTVERVSVADLHPHAQNERYKTPLAESSEEYQLMRGSMALDGLRNPLLVQKDTNIVISGHTRLRIARELGWKTVPVRYVDVDDAAAETMLVQDNVERAGTEKDLVKLARSIVRMYQSYTDQVSHKEALRIVSQGFGLQERQIDRMRAVLRLIGPLQALVSKGKIGLKASNVLAQLNEQQQMDFWNLVSEQSEEPHWTLTEERAVSYRDAIRAAASKTPTVPSTTADSFYTSEAGETDENSTENVAQYTVPVAIPSTPTPYLEIERDLDISNALRQVEKDKRALERMSSQSLPILQSALGHPDAHTVKQELADLKKRLKAHLKALDQIQG